MTGNEFIEHIRKKGSFVRPEDMESLISFYESKLLSASSADEEQQILASFGDPDDVIRRIKEEYTKLQLNTDPSPSPEEDSSPSPEEDGDDDIKIFTNASCNDDASPREEETPLQKAEPKQSNEGKAAPPKRRKAKRIKTEPDTRETPQKERTELQHPGIVNAILDKMKLKDKPRTAMKIVFSVLFSPVFVLLGLMILFLFLGAMAGIAAVVVVLCLIEAALIVISVVELIYGILALFSSIPVALIELGLGTVLISFAVAVTALVYQMLTGVIPTAAKKVNRFRKIAFRIFFELFFGSKGGKA